MKVFLVRGWEVRQKMAKRRIGYFKWGETVSHRGGWGIMFWFFGITFYTKGSL